MNFRGKFEQWHTSRYGYVPKGNGTAMSYKYGQQLVQARWEAWQACAEAYSTDAIRKRSDDR